MASRTPSRSRKDRPSAEQTERSPAPPSRHRHDTSEARHDPVILAATRRLQQMLGRRFLELRTERRLTQEAAAEAARLSVKAVSRVEHGSANLTLVVIVALARAYGTSVADVFTTKARAKRPDRPG